MKRLLTIIFILFSYASFSQFNADSVLKRADTTIGFERKLQVILKASQKRVLKNLDLDAFISKISEITMNESSVYKKEYENYYLGLIYLSQKKINQAISSLFQAIDLNEQHSRNKLTGDIHNKLALCYNELDNEQFALKHYYFAIDCYKYHFADEDLSEMYNSVGTLYKNKLLLDSALRYHYLALDIRVKLGNKKLIASTYNNIGLVYKKKKDAKTALKFLAKALELRRETNDVKGIAGTLINIGSVLRQNKNYKEALISLHEGTELAAKILEGDYYKNGILGLGDCYFDIAEYKKSAQHYLRFDHVLDSLTEGKLNTQILELSTQYESNKKDSELSLQKEKLKTQQSEIKKKNIFIFSSILILILITVLVLYIFKNNKIQKKNAENLEKKNLIIENKNKEITDSINYAKRIQTSLLASNKLLPISLPEHFIIYKPKDIVSGDFLWFHPINNNKDHFYLAVVDCTGHGVPGAFMSLIGKEQLDKATSQFTKPGDILTQLNINLKTTLQNEAQMTLDGMDIAMLKIKKTETGAELQYAGANRPLWIMRKDMQEIVEIKASKHSIGGFTQNDQLFQEHSFSLLNGDQFFMFTDGYPDQFGGEKAKKLSKKTLKKLLIDKSQLTINQKGKFFEEFLTNWMNNQDQVDDILFIGVKI